MQDFNQTSNIKNISHFLIFVSNICTNEFTSCSYDIIPTKYDLFNIFVANVNICLRTMYAKELVCFFRKDTRPVQDWYISLPAPTVLICKIYYTYLHSSGVTDKSSYKEKILFLPEKWGLEICRKIPYKEARRHQFAYPDLILSGAPPAH